MSSSTTKNPLFGPSPAGLPASDLVVTGYSVHDVRFPTSLTGDGTDAMNTTCDYSAAYLILYTGPRSSLDPVKAARAEPGTSTGAGLTGYGMTFTIGRGNDIVCDAIRQLCQTLVVGLDLEAMFAGMGATWSYLTSDPQFRWLGPETGVIHIATAAVVNALWDLFARSRKMPLWQLLASFTSEQMVECIPFRYITDAVTPAEALEIFRASEPHRKERSADLLANGIPAYTTSAGWSGYDDEKVARLTREALQEGFTHFKLKVGLGVENDDRRMGVMRKIIDDPNEMPAGHVPADAATLEGKNAGPTGCVLMIDSNQVFDVPEAITYMRQLAHHRPWFIEEPTAPTDVLGHAAIRAGLRESRMGVATGEHCPNRILFKQLLQADAIDVVQIDSCRLAGVNENLAVMLLARKFNKVVVPHAGGVCLQLYVQHLSAIDFVYFTGKKSLVEYVTHLLEHFPNACKINERGNYVAPTDPDEGYSVRMFQESIEDYSFPNGSYWKTGKARIAPPHERHQGHKSS